MSDGSHLERRYRRLLALYPRAFRREHEEEMLVVLLACARDGRRGSAVPDAANLLWNAAWMRIRLIAPRSVPSVFWGVRLMLLASFFELGCLGTVIETQSSVRAAVTRHTPGLGAAHLASLMHSNVVSVDYGAPIAAAIWLVLAWANDRGHSWARIGTVGLFGLTAMSLLASVGRHAAAYAAADVIVGAILCVAAFAAMLLTITADSNRHYHPRGSDSGDGRDHREPYGRAPAWRSGPDLASWN